MTEPETIRVPARITKTVNKVVRAARQILPEIGREPIPEKLAEKLAMPLEKVHRVSVLEIPLPAPSAPGIASCGPHLAAAPI
jgi:DNA-directed RNA polymerase sigma subunit (sigma70/sigma32)